MDPDLAAIRDFAMPNGLSTSSKPENHREQESELKLLIISMGTGKILHFPFVDDILKSNSGLLGQKGTLVVEYNHPDPATRYDVATRNRMPLEPPGWLTAKSLLCNHRQKQSSPRKTAPSLLEGFKEPNYEQPAQLDPGNSNETGESQNQTATNANGTGTDAGFRLLGLIIRGGNGGAGGRGPRRGGKGGDSQRPTMPEGLPSTVQVHLLDGTPGKGGEGTEANGEDGVLTERRSGA
ncbi:hypothetical protein FB45DRAFT_872916 [Roridomyces roridus]|uniref:Uncharacterized protein n=1 Tax=Roridomyces roridus TaxID=1738132 RepID=A0AAD7FEY3_9AGAR|nr:hypothetical protein FB45DRAFT_872916 [Roridomyces roridus]